MIAIANNHAGWVVEEFKKHDGDTEASWKAITEPKADETVVRKALFEYELANPTKSYRFYGAILPKELKD